MADSCTGPKTICCGDLIMPCCVSPLNDMIVYSLPSSWSRSSPWHRPSLGWWPWGTTSGTTRASPSLQPGGSCRSTPAPTPRGSVVYQPHSGISRIELPFFSFFLLLPRVSGVSYDTYIPVSAKFSRTARARSVCCLCVFS